MHKKRRLSEIMSEANNIRRRSYENLFLSFFDEVMGALIEYINNKETSRELYIDEEIETMDLDEIIQDWIRKVKRSQVFENWVDRFVLEIDEIESEYKKKI